VIPDVGYLTHGLPGVGGGLKQRPEDFLVEELPLYETSGSGEHLFLFIEKRGLDTAEVVDALAEHFGVRRSAVGSAGRKDRQAVARQHFSVHLPGRSEDEFGMLRLEGVSVLWADRHENKLRQGHLAGNRFNVRIRQTQAAHLLQARDVLGVLARRGVPNMYGPQRFGAKADNHVVGAALLRGEARRRMPTEKRRFYLNAMQSAVFNVVLDRRLRGGSFDRLLPGDLAYRHDNGSVFAVQDAGDAELTGRLSSFAISPSGPMWGGRMLRAGGEVGELEAEALAWCGLSLEALSDSRQAGLIPGARRPLRVPLGDPELDAGGDEHGPYLRVAFDLPSGAYATSVLREIMKTPEADRA
jgi:tRNA pseudouridine13 synthase